MKGSIVTCSDCGRRFHLVHRNPGMHTISHRQKHVLIPFKRVQAHRAEKQIEADSFGAWPPKVPLYYRRKMALSRVRIG